MRKVLLCWMVGFVAGWFSPASGQEIFKPQLPTFEWTLVSAPQQFIRLLSMAEIRGNVGIELVPPGLLESLIAMDGPVAASSSETKASARTAADAKACLLQIRESLGDDIARRLGMLRYQSLGLRYALLADPHLAGDLKITAHQREEIGKLPIGGLPPAMGGGDAKVVQAEEARILDDTQEARWQALRGPFYEGRLPLLLALKSDGSSAVRIPPFLSGFAYAAVLGDARVLNDLRFSVDKRAKAADVAMQLRRGDQEFLKSRPAEVPVAEMIKLASTRRNAVRQELAQSFTPEIAARLTQILRQRQGLLPGLKGDPEIREMLGFTAAQEEQLMRLLQSGEIPRPPRPVSDPEQMRKVFEEFREQADQTVATRALTEEQRQRWEEMTGPRLAIETIVPPFLTNLPGGLPPLDSSR